MSVLAETRSLWKNPAVLRLLIIALLAEIAFAALNLSSMPLYLRTDRGFGEGWIGIVMASFLFSEAVLKSRMGHLADKFGCKKMMIIAPLITVATSLATIWLPKDLGAEETLLMIGLRVCDGVAAAMLWPALFTAMSEVTPCEQRQESLSLLNSCYFLGIALAFPVAGIFNDLFGAGLREISGKYSPSFYLAAAVFAGCAYTAWKTKLPSTITNIEDGDGAEFGSFRDAMRRIPTFMVMGALTFIGMGLPMTIIQLFAKDQFKLSQSAFGFLVLPGAIALGILGTPISKFTKRYGTERSVHIGLALCAAGLFVMSMGAFVPLLRTLPALALSGIPIGVGFLIAIPAWYSGVSELDPARRGANIGAVMAAQGLGAIVGAILGGKFYEILGSTVAGRYSPFIGSALVVTAAFLLSLKILKTPEKSIESEQS